MALKIKTGVYRSENRNSNYGKYFRLSPSNKNEWIFSHSGRRFYNKGNITLLNLRGNSSCLHLKNGYPPESKQVVAVPFSSHYRLKKSAGNKEFAGRETKCFIYNF